MRGFAVLLFLACLAGCGTDGEQIVDAGGAVPNKPEGGLSPPTFAPRTPTATGAGEDFGDPPGTTIPQPNPTMFPSAPQWPTPTRTPAVLLSVDPVAGNPGQIVPIRVRLTTWRDPVAGVQNDLRYDGLPLRIVADLNGRPACAANAELGKNASAFAFLPAGCSGAGCSAVRAVIVATDNTDAIATGSVLYTCLVEIDVQAEEGMLPLGFSGVIAATPAGRRIAPVAAGGFLYVRHGPIPVPAASGSPCEIPPDCESAFCEDGRCCDAPCGEDSSCDIAGFEGGCIPLRRSGESCDKDADCEFSQICCADGLCGPATADDDSPCSVDLDCESAHCLHGPACIGESCVPCAACLQP
jgi:hypothetical protein